MQAQELKQAITDDLETLKSLDLEIMPSQAYYHANLTLFKKIFLRIYSIVIGATTLSIFLHWTDFFPNRGNTLYHSLITFVGSIILTGFIFLFLQDSLNNYVIFYHQIRLKLKSGEIIDQQIRRAGWLAYKIFAVIVIVPTLFLHPVCVLFAEFGAFFASAIITGLIIEMEMKRIGINVLFTLLKDYFDNSKQRKSLSH